jgi:hypothetical protein
LHVGTSYAWRVKASNSSGETYASNAPWTFTTASVAPASFSLSSPSDNSLDVSLSPTLTWTDSIGADTYQIEIATDPGFTSPQTATITAAANPSYAIPTALIERTGYYWRVTASNSAGSTVAGPFQFETKSASTPDIALSSPADTATFVDLQPMLSWTGSRADTYTVSVATNTGISSPVYQETVSAPTSSVTLPAALGGTTTYYWRVQATNDAGSTISQTWAFETKTTSGNPSAFLLTSPTNSATGVLLPPTLTWQDASGEDNYLLEIGTSSDGSVITAPTLTAPLSANQTQHTLNSSALTPGTEYFWQVLASNGTGTTFSDIFSFTTVTSGAYVWGIESPSTTEAEAYTTAIDANNIYVGGYATDAAGNSHWMIEKRTLSGGLVSAITATATSAYDAINGIVVDSNSLYAVGIDAHDGWKIEKRNLTDLQLDSTFGTIYSSPSLSTFDSAMAVARDSTYLYIVGYETESSDAYEQWRIEKRRFDNGDLVNSFNDDGVVTSATGSNLNEATAIAVVGGYMYVAGYESIAAGNERWRIEKRSLDTGALETSTFGGAGNGFIISNPSSGEDEATAIGVDGSSLYIVGYDSQNGSANTQWRIEKRSLDNGDLDSLFSSGTGSITINYSGGNDQANSIVIDSATGFMYIAGYDSYQWRVEKRRLDTGELDAAFGTSGVVSVNPSGGSDGAWSIAFDPENPYIYISGYDSIPGYKEWRVEKRVK